MQKRLSYLRSAGLGVATIILAGLAPSIFHFEDSFNNNSIGNSWTIIDSATNLVSETTSRLQFSTDGATGSFGYAGLEIERWGANVKRDFEIEVNSALKQNVHGTREIILGVGFANSGDDATYPDVGTVLAVGVIRDSLGLYVGWIRFVDGEIDDFSIEPITSHTGEIDIVYDRSEDLLTVERNGVVVPYEGFYTDFGSNSPNDPLVISLGCITLGGNVVLPGNKAWVDNFEFDGYRRTRPPT